MLQKRLDYGFNGYHVPFIPKAARSARRRGPVPAKVEDNQMCAFDVLATVAGKLLLGESSEDVCPGKDWAVNVENAVNKEQHGDGYPLKLARCDKESVEIPSLPLELGLQGQPGHCNSKEAPGPQHGNSSVLGSLVTSSDCLEKDDALNKMDLCDEKSELCSDSGKQDGCYPVNVKSCPSNVKKFVEQHANGERISGNGPDMHCPEDPKIFRMKPPTVVASDRSVKVALCNDQHHNTCGSLSSYRGNKVKEFSRDDDENSSECTQPSTIRTIRSRTRIGDRRIRKLLASKYWRVAPRVKDGDLSDTELRCLFWSRKFGYKRRRLQRIYPLKKRRFFRCSSLSNSNSNISGKGVHNSFGKVNDMTASSFGAVGHGVKLRIKSFRVPEFVIEMPETATVGSLKRTVIEAMTALLGGGLQIGVLLQGKMMRDDNRTLLQSGICHDDKVESLGFTLEPNSSHTSVPVSSEDNSLVLSTDLIEPVSRCPSTSTSHQGISNESSYHPVTNMGNLIESDHDSAPSPAEMSAEKGTADFRALVALPKGTPQALAVVPVNQKSNRSEIVQRRIRRPFSVAEVEALVQAVEELGTGRWRDVKQRTFDNVKHRTYVDLKDKWKTLVHTASISPQQRRGEPVPQELLDRVLGAHSFWSQQQAKQHPKHQPEACGLL